MPEKQNPRLKRHFSIVAHSPDIVELRYGVWNPISFTLTDDSASGRLYRVLSRLDGTVSPRELARQEKVAEEEVEALIDHLLQLGAAETGPAHALDHYLDHVVPTLAGANGRDLLATPVLLLGDPALAEAIGGYLRQSLPGSEIVAAPAGDPSLAVLAHNDTAWLMNGAAFEQRLPLFAAWQGKFLVMAQKVINPVQLRIANRVSLASRLSWLHAAVDGPFLLVGPLFVPYRTACYECFETRVAMNLREAASYQAYKRALVEGRVRNGAIPIEPALLGMLAAHTAFEALNYLLAGTTFTAGKVLAIYLPTMEITYHEVLRVVGCPACGSVPGRDEQELYFDARALLRE